MSVWALVADWDGSMMNHDNGGSGWWWVMGIFMLLVVVVAAVLVVWLVTRTAHATGSGAADPNVRAREILGERLARGEIDSGEYQERLNQLR